MSEQDRLEILSDLLNMLRYSLLQYLGESSPWTDRESQSRLETFSGLVRRQQFQAERLASLLNERRAVISSANYPEDCSQLHYVSLDYVKPKLIDNAKKIVATLDRAAEELSDDPEALRLVEQLKADEEQTIEALRSL